MYHTQSHNFIKINMYVIDIKEKFSCPTVHESLNMSYALEKDGSAHYQTTKF